MTINELIMDVRGAMKDGYHVMTADDYSKYQKMTQNGMSYKNFACFLDDHGLSVDNLWVIHGKTTLHSLFYVVQEKGLYHEIFPSKDYWDMPIGREGTVIELLAKAAKEGNEFLADKNYAAYYYMSVPDTFKIMDFELRYRDIPDDDVFEVWTSVHTAIDYSFSQWEKSVLDYVFARAPKVDKPDEMVTIYRGMGEKSQDIEAALSWTTSLPRAVWFACKNGFGKSVAKATIRRGDAIAFLDGAEDEVLFSLTNLDTVEYLPYLEGTSENLKKLVAEIFGDFQWICQRILTPLKKHYKRQVHSLSHIARVVVLTLLYCHNAQDDAVKPKERGILLYAALLHDIGRDHDGVDDEHGRKSLEFIEKNSITLSALSLSKSDREAAAFIIEYHCKDDELGKKALSGEKYSHWSVAQKKKTLHLYNVFKDMDGLDRVRIGDFNPAYLRTEFAPRMHFLAAALLKTDVLTLVK